MAWVRGAAMLTSLYQSAKAYFNTTQCYTFRSVSLQNQEARCRSLLTRRGVANKHILLRSSLLACGCGMGLLGMKSALDLEDFEVVDEYKRKKEDGLSGSLQYTTDDWNNTALVRSIRREYHYNSSSTVDGTTALIILTNFVVFGMWKVKRLQKFMSAHFVCKSYKNILRTRRFHTLLTSSFSHVGFLHFAANMFVFSQFAPLTARYLDGQASVLKLYFIGALSSGVASSLYLGTTRGSALGGSLGASGAVMTVAWAVHDRLTHQVSLLFLPALSTSASNALQALLAFDCVGLIIGGIPFLRLDHAGHIGGAAAGALYAKLRKASSLHNFISVAGEDSLNFHSVLSCDLSGVAYLVSSTPRDFSYPSVTSISYRTPINASRKTTAVLLGQAYISNSSGRGK